MCCHNRSRQLGIEQMKKSFIVGIGITVISGCGGKIDLTCTGDQDFSVEINTRNNSARVIGGIGGGYYREKGWEDATKTKNNIWRSFDDLGDTYFLEQQGTSNYGHNTTSRWAIDIDKRSLRISGSHDPSGGQVNHRTSFTAKCRKQGKQI